MKVVVISDLHGSNRWKRIIEKSADADLFVFIGDYFDSLEVSAEEQINNFKEIVEFARSSAVAVKLLMGNHEMHYLPSYIERGEQYVKFNPDHAEVITGLLMENMDQMQMALIHGRYLISHAGVTEVWLEKQGFKPGMEVAGFLNKLLKEYPDAYQFVGSDGYGGSFFSSPVWLRPPALEMYGYQQEEVVQIVGHTKHERITVIKDRFVFTDVPTSSEYLEIADGVMQVTRFQ